MVKTPAGMKWLPITDIEEWEQNPRINDGAVEPVARSLLRFGFVAPAVVWASEGRLVAGHTRLKAVRFLQNNRPVFGDEEDPGTVTAWEKRPADDPFHLLIGRDADGNPILAPEHDAIPVRMQEFKNEAEANAYALADNRLNELAEWDDDALAKVLRQLDDDDIDLTGLGWDDSDIDLMLEDFNFTPDPDGAGGQGRLDQVRKYMCPDCSSIHTLEEIRKATDAALKAEAEAKETAK